MWQCICNGRSAIHGDNEDRCWACGYTTEAAALHYIMAHPYGRLVLQRLKAKVEAGYNPEWTPICKGHAEALRDFIGVPDPDYDNPDLVDGYATEHDCVWCRQARRAAIRAKQEKEV